MFNILKLLLAIIGVSFLAEVSFGQGDAPAILKGLNQADKSIGAFIRTPNGQVTKISSSSALIETGNTNILENPNFEHSVYDTSWVIGSGISSKVDVNIDNTKVFSGLNALKMTMSAASLGVFNVSPIGNQAYKDGVQGLVSIRVKTIVSGIRVCQRKGFAITTNCVNVNPDGKWGLYKVPSILGEFYNGVEITSSPAVVTGDVYIDDAFVGVTDIAQISSAIGPWTTFVPTVSHDSGTMTNYTITSKVRQVGENLEVVGFIKFSAASAAFSGINIILPSNYTIDTTKLPPANDLGVALGDGSSYDVGFSLFPNKTYYITPQAVQIRSLVTNSGLNPVVVNGAQSFSNTTPFIFGATDQINFNFTAPIVQFSGSVSTYSTPSDSFSTDSNTLTHKTTAIVASDAIGTYNTYSYAINSNTKTICGSAPSILPNAADGFKIFTRAYNAASTCGNPARIEIKIGAAGAKFPTIKTDIYKSVGRLVPGSLDAITLGSTVDYGAMFKEYDESTGVLTVDAGFCWQTSITTHQFQFTDSVGQSSGYLVINAQKAKDFVVGQFNGLQSCTDTLACTDTFSAQVSSTGVVSGENVDWINGTCSRSGTNNAAYSCAFKSGVFTTAPNCQATSHDNSTQIAAITLQSTSTNILGSTTSAGVFAQQQFQVTCQKTGADYIGKTAMAVASDQNVRSIGSTNVDIQSVRFGVGADCTTVCSTGTCNICFQVGSKITSVSYSGVPGQYNLNGLDRSKYNCTGVGFTGSIFDSLWQNTSNGGVSAVYMQSASGANLQRAIVTCIGIP